MAKLRIQHNRKKCIGCGGCAMIASDYFEMAEDGKADLLKGAQKGSDPKNQQIFEREILDMEKDLIEVAIDACPTTCIKII